MATLQGFDAREVEPITTFEAIPSGQYLAAITDSEMKLTKNGRGRYLELTFTILEGEHKNRVLWARLNLENPNATAVKIARSELSTICRAVGVMTPQDSAELHNLPLLIEVKCKKRTDTDEIVNEIKGYARKTSGDQAPQALPTDNTPPWRRS